MLDQLIGLLAATRSGALPGVLIAAGAAATLGGGGVVSAMTLEQATPAPRVGTSAELSPSASPSPSPSPRPDASPTPDPCADEARARDEARAAVQAAYATYQAGIAQLRGEFRSARAADILARADAMLREIREKTDRILADLGRCQASAGGAVAAASSVDADATTIRQVADRAIAAMETIYNLAKSAVTTEPVQAVPAQRTQVKPVAKKPEAKKPVAKKRSEDQHKHATRPAPKAPQHSRPSKHDD